MRRQEEKYFLGHSEMSMLLGRYRAFPEYSSRQVNSVYFDTEKLTHFHDGEEGTVPRVKCRYRWYGSGEITSADGSLEIKRTYPHYREKEISKKKFNSYSEASSFFREKTSQVHEPVCFVKYTRIYYRNFSGLRFTYDFDIKVRGLKGLNFLRLASNVLEIKYLSNVKNHEYSNLLGNSLTRFSKYNEAVLKVIL